MSNPEETLRSETRRLLSGLDTGGTGYVDICIAGLKAAGAVKNACLGEPMTDGDDTCVRWYAGQAIDVLESGAYFAVNSLLNCLDRFCPAERP